MLTQVLRLSGSGVVVFLALLIVQLGIGSRPLAPLSREFRVCNTDGAFSQTIQSAVDVAQSGDVIKVAAGVYTESKNLSGFPYNLVITKAIHLYGGYTCADWVNRDPAAQTTSILPSTADISVVSIIGSFGQGALLTPTLDGFTISGGGGGNHGGGLRLHDSDALISHNFITGNVAFLFGGGIWVQRGAPRIEHNRIENNTATTGGAAGGGIELEGTQATLIDNLIVNNVISAAIGYGGGIAVDGGGPVTLTGNTLLRNSAAALTSTSPQLDAGYGGGISVRYATVTLSSNVVQSNTAHSIARGFGGGLHVFNSPAFGMSGNTVLSNTAGFSPGSGPYLLGGGVLIESSSGSLKDNHIAGNRSNRNTIFGNGGGLAALTSTLTIHAGLIVNNSVSQNCEGYGGGVYAFNSSISLDAVRVQTNCAANTPFYGLGGGLAFVNSPYTLTNNLIVQNYSFGNDTAVGGLYASANSPGLIVNNSIVNNRGQGIRSAAPLTLTNNLIMSQTTGISLTAVVPVSVTYNDFYANTTHHRGFALDVTNIVINPQLDADFHLQSNSPLIDAGTRVNAPDHDHDHQSRPMAGTSGLYRYDIGADEVTGAAQINRHLASQPADFTLIGPGNPIDNPGSNGSNDWIGYAALGGDINGDQRADLIVGAPNLSGDFDGGINDDGRVFALYGSGTRRVGTIDLYTDTASLEVRSWLHQQHIGRSFAASDLNGDGRYDLSIGSIGGDDNGKPVTGTVYVLAGGAALSGTRTLSPTMQAAYRFKSDQSTQSFAEKNSLAAGQLNGAGPGDLVVGEANATVVGRAQAGAVYVFFGSNNLPTVWDMQTLSASLTIEGAAVNAQLGKVALGDVNGDGQLDLVARSVATLHVFYGPLASGVRDLATTPANATITGLSDGPLATGDVDQDGRADIITGNGNQVAVIRGGTLPLSQTITTAAAARFTGVNAAGLHSFDWNGDGYEDITIGESFNNRAFVVFSNGTLTGTVTILDRADWIITGEKAGDQFGTTLSSGDLDADGALDLIIGSRSHLVSDRSDPNFLDAGAVYVFYGEAPPLYNIYLPLVRK